MDCLTSSFCCGRDDETGENQTDRTAIINNENNNIELNSKNNKLTTSIINNTININNEKKRKLSEECQELIKQKETLNQECQELIKQKETLNQECQELAKQKENLQQELNKLEEMGEDVVKKVLREDIINNVRDENEKMIEERIKKVYQEWSSEMGEKDKKITELTMENITFKQKMNELNSAYAELLTQYKETKELWKYRRSKCEKYEKELNELKKRIPEYININNRKSTKNLPYMTIEQKFDKK